MRSRSAGLALALAVAFALPARGQSYPAPTYQGVTLLADPGAATQAARKGYVDTAAGARILSSTLGQASGPAQLGSNGLLPVAQLPVGTASGTIAAGDDSRITGALAASTAATTYLPLSGGSLTGNARFGTGFANYVQLYGAATGSGPGLSALGSDANVSLVLAAKGTGTIYAANPLQLTTALSIANGGTGQTTAAAALTALGGAPINNPNHTGILTVGTAGTTFVNDILLPVQVNATTTAPAFFAVNKAGAYGLLFGYDPTIPAGVIRNVTTDPINFVVNNTVQALSMTSDGNARFLGIATAATLRVGTLTGPTWTQGTGAPTSTQPVGSIYSRTDGAIGSTVYVSRGGGTWAAVTGV